MNRPSVPWLLFASLLALLPAGCAPIQWEFATDVWLNSPREIASTSRNTKRDLVITELNVNDYPALKKFIRAKPISMLIRSGGTDQKMEALARVGFTNLTLLHVWNSPLVTDRGIEALSRIPSLSAVNLRGSGITDRGLETLSTMKPLTFVNVSKCTNVTLRGMLTLVQSDTLRSLEFSCENLTEANVIEILTATRRVKGCHISCPRTPDIVAVADQKGIKLLFEGKDFWYGY